MIQLYDTASGTVRELALREPGKVSMYVCGPTVQGLPHLGHGRFSLVFDILRRYLEYRGLDVRYVSNITDIEDKIIAKAAEEGVEFPVITERYTKIWFDTMDALGVKRPTVTPRATEYVTQMVALIERLVEQGVAYVTSDGVYLSVADIDGYGLLAHQSLDDLRAGESGRVDEHEEKRNPADFALWKLSKAGEPSWPSPWGDGRPGWHTECVVMSLDLLGEGFDLHGGGQDLKFPHHENERAQAVGVGARFANHWAHNGWVVDEHGEKMSKSIGNVHDLVEMVETYDPRAYRLLILQSHYRSPLTVNAETLQRATTTLGSMDGLLRRAGEAGLSWEGAELDPDAVAAFEAAMDDDLSSQRAIAGVFDLVRRANTAIDGGDRAGAATLVATVAHLSAAVGLNLSAGDAAELDSEAQDMAEARDRARAEKNWAEADRLRAALQAGGWVVEDTPQGTRIRRG